MNLSTGLKYIPRIRIWNKNVSNKTYSNTGMKRNSIEAANLKSEIRNQFSTVVRAPNSKTFLACQVARPSLGNFPSKNKKHKNQVIFSLICIL